MPLTAVAMFTACGGSAGSMIGPAGGVIESDDGAVLTIPPGALAGEAFITVRSVPTGDIAATVPDGAPYAGPVYSFEPHGLTFDKPVTIQLPTDTRANTILRLDDLDDDSWELAPGGAFNDTSVEFETDHFSLYAGGRGITQGQVDGGAYWLRVTATAPDCIPVVGSDAQVCGAKAVGRVEVVEESTAEILGACEFGESGGASTSSGPGRYTFWCERVETAPGTNEITIHAMQANLPLVHVYWFGTDAESPGGILLEEYISPADGLHDAGGGSYMDPYANRDFEFAGFKQFTFTTTEENAYDMMKEKALQPLQDAGFDARIFTFNSSSSGSTAIIDVYDTYDGRVKLQEDVILQNEWVIKSGADLNKGNIGAYETGRPLMIGVIPIYVTDITVAGEAAVSGSIVVARGGDSVVDATVTLNGTTIPNKGGGIYEVDSVGITGLGPDSTITIMVTTSDGKVSKTLEFACPPAIEFNSPTAGSTITAAGALGVQWAPGIPFDHASAAAGGAAVGNFACFSKMTGDEVNQMGHGNWFVQLEQDQTAADVEMGECARYLLELRYPGEQVVIMEDDGTKMMGYCTLQHRIWLYGP